MNLQSIIDGFVIAGMFLVRIGLPLAIMFAAAYWLRGKLELQTNSGQRTGNSRIIPFGKLGQKAAPALPTVADGHCWEIMNCDATGRAQCAAFKQPDLPCWLALQVGEGKLREKCFTCALYTKVQQTRA